MQWERDRISIRELFGLYQNYNLILQPFFQRNLVWTENAKSHFIESILLQMPISEIFLSDIDGKYSVIDGQQRLSTIFSFLVNDLKLQRLEKLEDKNGMFFENIEQDSFLNYEIGIVKITNPVKVDVIDMYSRINKYTVNLNDQELRKAAFSDSAFLRLSEKLSELEFFESIRMFTPRRRQRMQDVEFISELLCIQFEGIQDKKHTLDNFYNKFTVIENFPERETYFTNIIHKFEEIFGVQTVTEYYDNGNLFGNEGALNLGKTRFRQLADFYSLFAVVKEFFFVKGLSFDDRQKEKLANIILFYDEMIEPESDISVFSEYAIKCVSQGNTLRSRTFRYKFLYDTFIYIKTSESNGLIDLITREMKDFFNIDLNMLNFTAEEVISQVDEYYKMLEDGED